MLTHRLYYRIIRRAPLPLPPIYKHECVRTFVVRVGGKRKRQKTPRALVEVRVIMFSDDQQYGKAATLCFQLAEEYYRRARQYYESMIDFAEFAVTRKYDFTSYALMKIAYLEGLRADIRLMRKDEYARRVTLMFFMNWWRIVARLQSQLYGLRPPRVPDYVALVLQWDPDTLELQRVCTEQIVLEPSHRVIIPWDCSKSFIYTRFYEHEWGLRLGEPDPPPDQILDNYFTIDLDCFDTDDTREIHECLWQYRKIVGYLWLAKYRGDVKEFKVYETERGYHIIVYTNKMMPIYKVRLILGDDEDRLKMDITRYYISGIHDTLFTNKEWMNIDSPPKKPRRNEYYKGDDRDPSKLL